MSDYSPTAFLSSTRLPDDIIQEIFIWYVNDDPFVDVPFLPIEEERCSMFSHWDLDVPFLPMEEERCSSYSHRDSDDSEDDDSEDDDDSDYSVRSSDEISSFEEKPFINHLPLPFVASHVCSAWRRVALSTPRLWSNVCIKTFGPCSKRLAAEWLLKAGSCPLFITIFNLVSDPHFNIYDELREFLSAYNIKSLELPLLSQTCPLLPLLLAELPDERIIHLESLSLTDLEYGRNEFLFLDNARYPFLRELQLIGRFVGDMIIFPWISLRHLDASTALLPVMQCLHILRDSVSLEVCYLGVSSDTGSESSVGDLNLPTLNELTLSFNFDADVGDFIKRLTTPNLKVLAFDRGGSSDEIPLRWSDLEYSNMMHRSNGPLNHLAIRQTNEVNAHSVLQSSPMLVEVNLHRARFWQKTLDDLATGRLAPLLQHFCVDEISGVDNSAISKMIERRTQNSVCIGGTEHRLMPFSSVMSGRMMDANFDFVYPARQHMSYYHEPDMLGICDCISCILGS